MPRYFIDTFDHLTAIDVEGLELAGLDAVRREVKRALGGMMRDAKGALGSTRFRAHVRDEAGETVMRATLLLIVE